MEFMRRNRKNYLKLSLTPFAYLVLLIIYINIFPPENRLLIGGFYLLLGITVFQLVNIFTSKTRSMLWTGGILILLILKQLQIANFLNIALLLGVMITVELYLRIER